MGTPRVCLMGFVFLSPSSTTTSIGGSSAPRRRGLPLVFLSQEFLCDLAIDDFEDPFYLNYSMRASRTERQKTNKPARLWYKRLVSLCTEERNEGRHKYAFLFHHRETAELNAHQDNKGHFLYPPPPFVCPQS